MAGGLVRGFPLFLLAFSVGDIGLEPTTSTMSKAMTMERVAVFQGNTASCDVDSWHQLAKFPMFSKQHFLS